MGLQIDIVKSANGRNVNDTFRNGYWLHTTLKHNSADAKELAIGFGDDERRIYSKRVAFMRAIITETDAYGKPIAGKSRSFPLTGTGSLTYAAGVVMAPEDVVAIIAKLSHTGAAVEMAYKHCVTAEEWEAYQTTQVIPDRFKDPNGLADALTINFIEALKNRAGAGSARHAIPLRKNGDANEPRFIEDYIPAGIHIHKATRDRESGTLNSRQAAQQLINELAGKARRAKRGDKNGLVPDASDKIVKDLKAQAQKIYEAQPAAEQGFIIWPQVFDNNPFTK